MAGASKGSLWAYVWRVREEECSGLASDALALVAGVLRSALVWQDVAVYHDVRRGNTKKHGVAGSVQALAAADQFENWLG